MMIFVMKIELSNSADGLNNVGVNGVGEGVNRVKVFGIEPSPDMDDDIVDDGIGLGEIKVLNYDDEEEEDEDYYY
ncbi:MAG: hypothetical protein EZS28_051184 [Streblomastix strix]|uniref:Uncharacterized protein n=1 Tax=Streblomastix strix TaxID=222440 RepID=A0A5J4T4F1_9EUKA|nr:MAG: hypothetical protein EZS28_051184 [Streblomastix strix]